jgi:hypothetical protein
LSTEITGMNHHTQLWMGFLCLLLKIKTSF